MPVTLPPQQAIAEIPQANQRWQRSAGTAPFTDDGQALVSAQMLPETFSGGSGKPI